MANRCVVAVLLLLQLIAFANAQNATSAPTVTSAPTTVITGNVRPSGVVFDIRTYTSSSWLTDPEAVFVQMLSLFQTLPTWWNAGGAPVQYAVVLPTFLNNEYLYSYTINGITNTYSAFLTNTLYSVNNSKLILLNEKTTSSGLINNGLSECQYAASLGISCTFMVDVNNDTDSTSSFVGTSLVYVQQTLAATAQGMTAQGFTSVTFNDVLLYDITGLQVLPEKQPAYTEPSSTKVSVEVVISDPYFLYLSSSSINAVFDTTSTMARCCGFVVDKITIDATVYVQSAPSLLQSFINLAASNGISVDLYLSDPTWGFDTSHADLQAALTLVLQFIYNGTVTYPPSATLPSPPPGFIVTPTPVPSALPSSSPSASASPSSSSPSASPSSSSSPSASASPSMSSGSGSTSAPSSSPTFSAGSGSTSAPSSSPSLSSGSGSASPPPSSSPTFSAGSGLTSAPSLSSGSGLTSAPTPVFNGDTSSSAPTSASTSTTGGSPSQSAQTSSAVGSGELATIALKLITVMVLSLAAVAIV